jgi:hypothetical protein
MMEPAMFSDTAPEAERVQIELLRKATVAQRISMMRSLTATVSNLSRRAIARANPGLDQRELDILFVRHNYGERLADAVREQLARRES